MNNASMEDLVSLCKRRGFIYQSNEIYGGLQGLYDYGPLGVELKNNLKLFFIIFSLCKRNKFLNSVDKRTANKKMLQVNI